jgi:hypothetical protein
MNVTSGHKGRNCAPCKDYLEVANCSSKQLVFLDGNSRCNKNGIDILPEIPEESEESIVSEFSDTPNDEIAVYNDLKHTEKKALHCGARSMESCLQSDKMNVELTDNCIENKRWSIGTVAEMMQVCVENGLAGYKSNSDNSSSSSNKSIIMIINSDNKITENKPLNTTLKHSGLEFDRQFIKATSNTNPANSEIWMTKSLSDIDSKLNKADVIEFDSVQSKSIDMPNILCIQGTDSGTRKIRSVDSIEPVFHKDKLINERNALIEVVLISNINSTCRNSCDKISKSENELIACAHNMNKPTENTNVQKRWSVGSFEQLLSTNDSSPAVDDEQVQSFFINQKWYSTELRTNNQPTDYTGISENLLSKCPLTFELLTDETNTNINIPKTLKKCPEINETELSSLNSEESVHPLWTAKLMSSEAIAVDHATNSCHGSNSLRRWSGHQSSLTRVLRRLMLNCSCNTHQCCNLKLYEWNHFLSLYWKIPEWSRVHYFFPSLLLQLSLRLCPIGFAALSPLLAKRSIDGCTNKEAVFSVSVSGFVWLCFLLVTPWCSKILPSKRKYLFVAGNVLSACGLHRKYQLY